VSAPSGEGRTTMTLQSVSSNGDTELANPAATTTAPVETPTEQKTVTDAGPRPPAASPPALNPAALFARPDGSQLISHVSMPSWLIVFGAVVVVGIGIGGFDTTPGGQSAANGAAALAIISGSAVVIERVLEAFWTFIDSRFGSWWPFSIVHDAISKLVADFDQYVKPYFDRLTFLRDDIAKLHSGDAEWQAYADTVLAEINAGAQRLKDLATQLKDTQVGNDQKLGILVESASNEINGILTRHPDLQQKVGKDVDLAKSLTDDVDAFLSTFNDNPARRSISLIAGCLLGFAIALVLRLDLFSALGVSALGPVAFLGGTLWGAGVPLTGLIMGLGSSPTHEVIQAIQQYKQNQ
jgi:hypothetical protein